METTAQQIPSPKTVPPTGAPVIELIDVHKELGGRAVLSGVDLSVLPGETLVIIGRSGTGKSVTLRHIMGLLSPDHGAIKVFGEDLAAVSKRRLKELRMRLGYLFQSGALINWLTVEENVALPLLEHRSRLRPEEVRAKVFEKLRLVSMEDAAAKYPPAISGGMKKRAGLARAIVLEPEVVLYDEPTSGLDPVMAATIDELIVHTREALGVAQVVVTHDMQSAYRIADRIAMLHEGRIIAQASPEELRRHPHPVVQQFITGSARGPITDRDANNANLSNGASR
jgi:phospholipid/cholesterol/gamma-HCH transport system ATP-binding protein